MRVVDTSAWIEWLVNPSQYEDLRSAMPAQSDCVVPTIVQLELSKWLLREAGEDVADRVIAYTQTCVVQPLDTQIALQAAALHRAYKLATADAIVYATAHILKADLLTFDTHFSGLPDVLLFNKRVS